MGSLSDNFRFIAYNPDLEKDWDAFVDTAINKHFFFKRTYVEYHSHKFKDHSLLVYEGDKLISLLVANIDQNCLYSHQGLTFGGFIWSERMKAIRAYNLVEEFKNYISAQGINKLVYKAMPYIYLKHPSHELEWALSKHGATITRRDINSVIDLRNHLGVEKGRVGCIKKAQKAEIKIEVSSDIQGAYKLMEDLLLSKHGTKPVHSFQEISLLVSRFPANIKVYTATLNEDILACTVVYINDKVIKTQYISSSERGRELGAVDLLMQSLVEEYEATLGYFDFGTSPIPGDTHGLSEGLIQQKEMFGARAVLSETYTLDIAQTD